MSDYPAQVQQSDHAPSTVDLDSLAKQHGASLSDVPQQPQGSALYRFGSNLGEKVNPATMIKGTAQVVSHPIDSYIADADARGEVLDKSAQNVAYAKKQWNQGHYLTAIDHIGGSLVQKLYSMIPFVGTQLESAGEKFDSGDWAGGAGQSIGMGLQMAGPSALLGKTGFGSVNASPKGWIDPLGSMAGTVSPVARVLSQAGRKLTDYAPELGERVGQAAEHGGMPGAVVAFATGHPEAGAASLAGSIAAPAIENGVTSLASKAGTGMQWLANLMSADASGIQPLPLTKSVMRNTGMRLDYEGHLAQEGIEGEIPRNQQLALPPGPIQLGPSSASTSSEGVLPAQKIIVRDPRNGQMKPMYTSGTGPTIYQEGQPPADAVNVLSPEQIRSFKIADKALDSMQEWERQQSAREEMNRQTGSSNEPSPEIVRRMNTPERWWGRPNAPGSLKLPTVRDSDMSVVMQDNQPYYQAVDKQLAGMSGQQASDLAKKIGSDPDHLRLDLAKRLKQQDMDMSTLLKQSIDQVNKQQGGHAGGGVTSVEELNRPGVNYVVTKGGRLTYQGKAFAPESTPAGASHVTVLPNGQLRVNAGPALTAVQESALRDALRQ